MRRSVLIVEDNRSLAENIAELLEEGGGRVVLAGSATEAARLAKTDTFDLAIVDVRLPDAQSGVELVPVLRQASPDLEVILMTANATLDTAIAAVRHGVFAFVLKPFSVDDLEALAERALAQVALRRERMTLARELARSEAHYRAVADTVDALIVDLDAEGKAQLWNRRAAEVTGWPAAEALGGDPCDILVPAESREACRAMIARGRAGGPEANGHEIVVQGRDGARRIVRWRFAPRSDGTLMVGVDVTDQIALSQRAAHAEAMAWTGTLTAGLAHEIRNPLNAAKLQLELLSRAIGRVDDEALRAGMMERRRIVGEEIARLSRMLDEFLDLARPRHGPSRSVALDSVIEDVVHLQAPLAESAGVSLRAEIAPSLPPVMGEEGRIKQALINLIVNAIDALRDRGGGGIVVSAAADAGSRVHVDVMDDGPGIPDDLAATIFEPFVTSKPGGTGLGRSIVKRIVETLGGTIALLPRPGGGTIARLDFVAEPGAGAN